MAYAFIPGSITSMLFTVLLLLFVCYACYLCWNNVFRRLGIPGPSRIPFLGDIVNVMRKGVNQNDIDLIQKYGQVVGVYEGNTPVILIANPDLLRNVLVRDSHVFINRRFIEGIAGALEHGLTALQDEHWKNARAIVSPTFSTAKLKAMYSLMDEVADVYSSCLQKYADKQEPFNANTLNGELTLDTIASCLFGIETNSLKNENVTLIQHLRKFFVVDLTNIYLYVLLISPRLAGFLGKRGYSIIPRTSMEYVTTIVHEVLARRRQRCERRNDFIQIMVDHEQETESTEQAKQVTESKEPNQQQWGTLKKTLSDKEIIGQALLFLIAGYETTSVLLSFFFYVMATEPDIQEKVYEEILQEIGDDKVTHDKIGELHYLDMVINETLRMYPPFIRFDRVASQDYQLGEYRIPKGSFINVPVYPIHHDPEVWPDPERFIPERFSSNEKAKRHPMSFLPFGDGPRNCIGMRFALLEAKLAIVKALRVVEIQRCEKTEVPLQLGKTAILTAKNGIWVRAVRRSE